MPTVAPQTCLAIDYGHYSVKSSHFTAALGSTAATSSSKGTARGRKKRRTEENKGAAANAGDHAENTTVGVDDGQAPGDLVEAGVCIDTASQQNAWGWDDAAASYVFDDNKFCGTISAIMQRHGFMCSSSSSDNDNSAAAATAGSSSGGNAPSLGILSLHLPLETSPHDKELALHNVFEKLGVEKLHMSPAPVVPLFATGVTSGVVVDLGETAGRIVPIRDGALLPIGYCFSRNGVASPSSFFLGAGVVSSPVFGGQYLSDLTIKLLSARNAVTMRRLQQQVRTIHFRDMEFIKSRLFTAKVDPWDPQVLLSSSSTSSAVAVHCHHTLPDGAVLELSMDARDCVVIPSTLLHPLPLVASLLCEENGTSLTITQLRQWYEGRYGSTCSSGYHHGLVEAVLRSIRESTALLPLLLESSSVSTPHHHTKHHTTGATSAAAAIIDEAALPLSSSSPKRCGILVCGGTSLIPGLIDALYNGFERMATPHTCGNNNNNTAHRHRHASASSSSVPGTKGSQDSANYLPMLLPNSPLVYDQSNASEVPATVDDMKEGVQRDGQSHRKQSIARLNVPLLQLRDRAHGVIHGSMIIAQLSVFDSAMCMTKALYEELGPQVLLSRYGLATQA